MVQTESDLQPYTGNNGRLAMSSCMSCHGSAEYQMESFLLPGPSYCEGDRCRPTFAVCNGDTCTEAPPGGDAELVYYSPGSSGFMRWFQDRAGNIPMDMRQADGSKIHALDYGMNNAFKALPAWFEATGQPGVLNFIEEFNNYRGLRPDHDD